MSEITHPLDTPLVSSPRDYEDFIANSLIWKDMKQTILDRIEILTDDLVSAQEDKDIYKLQAQIRVWKEMLALPFYLLEHANIEQTMKEKGYAKDSEEERE